MRFNIKWHRISCAPTVFYHQIIFNFHKKRHGDIKNKFCPCGNCSGYQFTCICGKTLTHHCQVTLRRNGNE